MRTEEAYVVTEPIRRAVFSLGLAAACAVPVAARAAERGERAPGHWAGPTSQHLWIDAQAGVESVNLQTFNADFDTVSVGLLPTSGVGPTANVGAGIRLVFLTLGVRGHVASFEDNSPTRTVGAWQIWALDGELGLRAPLGRLEPHGSLAAGYASFGGFGSAIHGLSKGLDVHGVDGRLEGGIDYWVTHTVSVGADLSGGLLAIVRPGISARDLATPQAVGTINEAKARVLEANGSSVGWMFEATLDLGVHF
jgi:hypothetical protein